jgi:hypothetical protein
VQSVISWICWLSYGAEVSGIFCFTADIFQGLSRLLSEKYGNEKMLSSNSAALNDSHI